MFRTIFILVIDYPANQITIFEVVPSILYSLYPLASNNFLTLEGSLTALFSTFSFHSVTLLILEAPFASSFEFLIIDAII